MKRFYLLVSISLLLCGTLFADEKVLIDFSKLAPDILQNVEGRIPQNQQTVMDFSRNSGTNYTAEQKQVMRTSLAIPNWIVELASSSKTVINNQLSFTKVSTSKQFGVVMGARVHFPEGTYNSWALIRPPFEIPAYEFTQVDDAGNLTAPQEYNFNTTQSRFEDGYGIIKNVGAIKAIQVTAYGLNFPHALYAVYIDGAGNEVSVYLGNMEYDGWRDLRWDNPQYVKEVRARDLRIFPLYPSYEPFIRFVGFRVKRDALKDGGDFVTYFKDVTVIYDRARMEQETDIDDESEWDIIKERYADRQKIEMREFGKDQVYRFLESEKMAPETDFKARDQTN
ncbi:MAG: flagellar filament outer layer protein FlaA [Termitinemataceae bacterium]|nr:MAG: flagellar filament outer layer protein FlaA [Termitinemataceae bacterium]